ncbi:MAG: tyrosine-protein phosphatase [Planctomycetes bacterium]|nr:tyrosine-protein phosphatase [Planctomycetota bacterium]
MTGTRYMAAAVILAGISCSCRKPPEATGANGAVHGEAERNPRWAVPMEGPGLGNFYKVSEDLYRGEQPTAEGIRTLKKMGIKTVVSLRSAHSDRDEIGDTDIGYVHVRCTAGDPDDAEVLEVLKALTDKSGAPYFIHCQHGADRTGMMVAVYRMAVEGWSNEDALAEMTEGGYGFHKIWKDIPAYVKSFDAKAVRAKLEEAAGREGR